LRLLIDNVYQNSHLIANVDDAAAVRKILPNLLQHAIATFMYYIYSKRNAEEFKGAMMNSLRHWTGVHTFPYCFYGDAGKQPNFERAKDCELNVRSGTLSITQARAIFPTLLAWTSFVTESPDVFELHFSLVGSAPDPARQLPDLLSHFEPTAPPPAENNDD